MSAFVLNTILIICGSLIGLTLGWLIAAVRAQRQHFQLMSELKLLSQQAQRQVEDNTVLTIERQQSQQLIERNRLELGHLHIQLAATDEKLQQQLLAKIEWREEYEKLNQELRMLREINSSQEAELREVTIRLEENRLSSEEKQRLLINSEQRLNLQFENLANRIFEQSGQKVNQQNRQSLESLLIPLREQLDGFRRQVQEGFGQEARERHTLAHEIRNLQQLNAQMAQEAINLTNALKGDNKIQGNWGEVILSRILETSGLRDGYEYQTQVNLCNEHGERQQPDVVVHLPQGKDVVIDAKMSLVAYERYFNSDSTAVCEQALSEHVASIRNHIKLLGRKDYQDLAGLRSLDYILMFIPIEPAFLLAVNREPDLINEALQHNIMLVSPTSLLVALRTINNLWRYENQNQNAKQIAERATRLYDKMRLFIDDMLYLGQSLEKSQRNYQQAMSKLSQGRGNMVSQIEGFRSLGVDVKKPINNAVIDGALDELQNDIVDDVSDKETSD